MAESVATGTGLGGDLTAVDLDNFDVADWEYVSISGHQETVAMLDDTHLGSSIFMESIPVNLAELNEITVTVHWLYEEDTCFAGAATPLHVGAVGSITLTMPTRTGFSTAGTLIGTAFITNVTMPDKTTGDRSIGSYTFKFDGKTGPTYTKSAAP